MGLAASQARFLELTARKSNIEYEAQQISAARLQLADKADIISSNYQEKTSNKKLVYLYNDGVNPRYIDVTYSNYKNYMNNNKNTAQKAMYLLSSSGNKIVVASKEDMYEMIKNNKKSIPMTDVLNAKAKADTDKKLTEEEQKLASVNLAALGYEIKTTTENTDEVAVEEITTESSKDSDQNNQAKEIQIVIDTNDNDNQVLYYEESKFTPDDFIIDETLTDIDEFQRYIHEGIYCFGSIKQEDNEDRKFVAEMWETAGGGAITEEYDKSDDAEAQAEYDKESARIEKIDKKLQLRLDQLETERKAIETEMDSVSKVIKDNIQETFKTEG